MSIMSNIYRKFSIKNIDVYNPNEVMWELIKEVSSQNKEELDKIHGFLFGNMEIFLDTLNVKNEETFSITISDFYIVYKGLGIKKVDRRYSILINAKGQEQEEFKTIFEHRKSKMRGKAIVQNKDVVNQNNLPSDNLYLAYIDSNFDQNSVYVKEKVSNNSPIQEILYTVQKRLESSYKTSNVFKANAYKFYLGKFASSDFHKVITYKNPNTIKAITLNVHGNKIPCYIGIRKYKDREDTIYIYTVTHFFEFNGYNLKDYEYHNLYEELLADISSLLTIFLGSTTNAYGLPIPLDIGGNYMGIYSKRKQVENLLPIIQKYK